MASLAASVLVKLLNGVVDFGTDQARPGRSELPKGRFDQSHDGDRPDEAEVPEEIVSEADMTQEEQEQNRPADDTHRAEDQHGDLMDTLTIWVLRQKLHWKAP